MSYLVICCGSRHWRDRDLVRHWLAPLYAAHPDLVVIHGDQVSRDDEGNVWGADRCVREVCDDLGIPQRRYPAQWRQHGRAAGPIRNAQMFDENPDVREVLAFYAVDTTTYYPYPARGTNHCVNEAMKRRIPVSKHYDEFWID